MITTASIKSYKKPALLRGENSLVLAPHELLQPFIANYTFTCPESMPEEMCVLPSLSTTLVYSMDSSGIIGGLRGVSTEPAQIGAYARRFTSMMLVEFHCGGLHSFTGIDQNELLNQGFSFGALSPSIDREITSLLYNTNSIELIVKRLDAIFLAHLRYDSINPALAAAINQIVESRGIFRCSQLAKEVHYSQRQLNRLFRAHIGAGVKTFSRIVRIKHSAELLSSGSMDIAQISEAMGYYDPSHFVRDVRDVCAMTPGELRDKMSLFYNDPFKLT